MESVYDAVRTHLSNVSGLASLRLQNHLYGCYLLLEDIVQKNVTLSGTVVQSRHVTFDLQKQFSEIGLRYGFAMDTQLLLVPCPEDYKTAWIHILTSLKTLEEVDVLEEKMNEIIRQVVHAEDAFFVSTAETGSLPPQWVDRALTLLLASVESTQNDPAAPEAPSEVPSVAPTLPSEEPTLPCVNPPLEPSVEPIVTPIVKPSVSPTVKALVEPTVKPSVAPLSLLEKHKDNPKRTFATTRRKKLFLHPPKRILAVTRRSTKPTV